MEPLESGIYATFSRGGTLNLTSTKVSSTELLTIVASALQGSVYTASDITARNAAAKMEPRPINFELFVSCRPENRSTVFNEVKVEAEKIGLEAKPFFINGGHIKGGPNYFFIKVYGENAESAEILLSNLRKNNQFIEQTSSPSKVHGRTGLLNLIRYTVEIAKPKIPKGNKPKETPSASPANFPSLPTNPAPASIATPAPAATGPTTTTMASAPIAATTSTDQGNLAKMQESMASMTAKLEAMQEALTRMHNKQAQVEKKQGQMEEILSNQDKVLQAMTGIFRKWRTRLPLLPLLLLPTTRTQPTTLALNPWTRPWTANRACVPTNRRRAQSRLMRRR